MDVEEDGWVAAVGMERRGVVQSSTEAETVGAIRPLYMDKGDCRGN